MPAPTTHAMYHALVIPNDALDKGGLEILRAGIVEDELYVTARRTFEDPALWGEALDDIARRIAAIYFAGDSDLSERDIIAKIGQAFAADLGTAVVKDKSKKAAGPRMPKRKAAKKTRVAKARRKG